VLVIVQRRDGKSTADWLKLLPSTRLRLKAGLIAPRRTGPGQDVAAVVRARADGRPPVVGTPSAAQRGAGLLRAGLREATADLPPDARGLLPGLVVGDTSRLTADLDAAFRATDMTHLLAVSGANLTILLAVLIGPPGSAQRAERRGLAPRLGISLRGTAVLGALLTVGFIVVCRPEASVVRAAACGLITVLAIATGRRRTLVPALAAAVLLLLLCDPWLALDVGFALSVLATGALLTVAPRWSAALRRRGVPGRLAEPLAAAAAAQAVCAPVAAMIAAHVSLIAVPCNVVAEFAVAPATVLGFAALAVAPVSMPAATALGWLASWPTRGIAAIARLGAGLPGAEIAWPGSLAGAALLALSTGAVVLLAARLRLLRRPWLCAACALLLLLAVIRPVPLVRPLTGWPPPGWRLVACDVGQGDALALATGRNHSAVVIDTGPDPETVDRCLRGLGITSIPLLVLTHFHADHVDGLPGALKGRSVGAIETTTVDDPPGQAEFVRRTARRAGVSVTHAVTGERRHEGWLSWEVLWPLPAASRLREPTPGPNDASVTLFLRTAGLSLLLPGDLEPDAQRQLLADRPHLPAVDVLKVAHHGSAYQDAGLLERVRPRIALISCGADNPYGHPSPRTLTALRAEGALVSRTDLNGALAVTASPTSRASPDDDTSSVPSVVTERGTAQGSRIREG
jgi:competence protein ComEC